MKRNAIAIVGAAESTRMGKVPDMGQLQLHADAALNTLADCGLAKNEIDGLATAGHDPAEISHYLGLSPSWTDGTSVGGCSFITHVRHAAAAMEAGLCSTVLITHGESGRSGHRTHRPLFPSQFSQQFEMPYGATVPATKFTLPVMRFMKDCTVSEEQLAMIAVVQRQWAAMH
ncbi:MAG: thiolase, partial [Pseudomonadota bacterium]